MALFLCRANQLVGTGEIVDELWGDAAPKTAGSTTQTYVYQLRKILNELSPDDGESAGHLQTRPLGYVLHVSDEQVDARIFEHLADLGRDAFEAQRYEDAVDLLGQAIALWSGPVLSNVLRGEVVRAHAARLEEVLLRARELHIDAMFLVGRHTETISELTMLAETYPLNEWIHARLIQAMSWSGRRSDALRVYRRIRTSLAEELGLDPSPDLQRLELALLGGGSPVPVGSPPARVPAGPVPEEGAEHRR